MKAMLLVVSGCSLFGAAFCMPDPLGGLLIAGAGLNLVTAGLVR